MTDPSQPLPSRRALRETAAGAEAPERGAPAGVRGAGIAALIAKHPKVWLVSALSVAFVVLGTGAVFAGVAAGTPQTVALPTPSPSADLVEPRTLPATMPVGSPVRTCSIAQAAADPRLGTLSGIVVNADTGEVLFDRDATVPLPTASVLQILTASAVLSTLGPDARLTTRVVAGSAPGSIVLVGGGDPTLATTTATLYEGAPQLSELAKQVRQNWQQQFPGEKITSIVLDSTAWSAGDSWDSSWPASALTSGLQPQVTALMVNGGRADPSQDISPRSNDPVGDAGRAFAAELGLDDVAFSTGAALDSTVLGQVQSQPVSVLIEQMLDTSDAALAENLGRVLAKTIHSDGSSASVARAMVGALQQLGVEGELTIRDASGRSDLNRVSAKAVAGLLMSIHANEGGLGLVRDAMPVAGKSGDMWDRFEGSPLDGAVAAVPGSIANERSLAGLFTAADGTPMAFVFYAIKDGIERDARQALDAVTSAAYACGSNLSSY